MNNGLVIISRILIVVIVLASCLNSYHAITEVPERGMTPVYIAVAWDVVIGAFIFLMMRSPKS